MPFPPTFPEELLHWILAIHFDRNPKTFCNTQIVQRDKRTPVNPPRVALLVSKQWQRVGTPLLYKFLSISNPDHTEAVAKVVDSSPILLRHIRHVRLRGGFNAKLPKILSSATNIHSISIDLWRLKSTHSIAGLQKSFSQINPSALYVIRDWSYNKKRNEAISLLATAIAEEWTNLVRLNMLLAMYDASRLISPQKRFHFSCEFLDVGVIVDAIVASDSLEEVLIDYCTPVSHLHPTGQAPPNSNSLSRILAKANIERILYRNTGAQERLFIHSEKWLHEDARSARMRMQREIYPEDAWSLQRMRDPSCKCIVHSPLHRVAD